MVTGKELTTGKVDQTSSLPVEGDHTRMTGHKAADPLRSIFKLYGAIRSRVPIGYEDEQGFHYGADLAG